jgi:hypothetical protein
MATKFKVGDKVRWNAEAGMVSGTIIKIHKKKILIIKVIHTTPRKMRRNMKLKAINPSTLRRIKNLH